MGLEKLLNIRKKEKKNECSSVIVENKDVPKVVFDDLELQVTIGQWLGLLSSSQSFGNSSFKVYTHLDAEELMKRLHIPAKTFNEIAEKFGILLKACGIENSETCIIRNYDKKNFSFRCDLKNSCRSHDISLRWGDWMDFGPQFVLKDENSTMTYDYISETEERPIGLQLQNFTINNPENGNSCYRFYSPYSAYYTLENGQYTFKIEISCPESKDIDVFNRKDFVLKNEEQLKKYLLGLSLPFDICEVYKRICEISLGSAGKYPKISLNVTRNIDKNNNITTDNITLEGGKLKSFIITKDGKTISIDNKGNWAYSSSRLDVSQNYEGLVNYNLKALSQADLEKSPSPLEQFNSAKDEVDGVKVFVKTIFKN